MVSFSKTPDRATHRTIRLSTALLAAIGWAVSSGLVTWWSLTNKEAALEAECQARIEAVPVCLPVPPGGMR